MAAYARPFRQFLQCVALAVVAAGGVAPAAAQTIELWHRPGGYTHLHIAQADVWLRQHTRLVIRDWQESAAAIQVVYFKRHGGNICYAKAGFNSDPALFFHLSTSRGVYGNDLAYYIGANNAAKIGELSADSLKRFHPSAFGIGACPGGIKADDSIVPRPSIMRW